MTIIRTKYIHDSATIQVSVDDKLSHIHPYAKDHSGVVNHDMAVRATVIRMGLSHAYRRICVNQGYLYCNEEATVLVVI